MGQRAMIDLMPIFRRRPRHLAAAALGLTLAAPAEAKTLRVVTTTPDLAAVAREVAGAQAEVHSLASPVANAHAVDPKPSYIVKLMKADLFIQTGLELESGWAPSLVQGSRNPAVQAGASGHLQASDAVEPMDIPKNPSRAMGDVHPGGNPHFMIDPNNALAVARAISRRLAELAPEKATDFEKNLLAFEAKAQEALERWKKLMEPWRGTKYVSYHKDWIYFARLYGLIPAGEIEPKPGIPPTPAHTAKLIAIMKAEGVRLLLTDPWYEKRTAESIAAQTGAKLLAMALYPGAAPDTGDFFSWNEHNVRLVSSALAGPAQAASPAGSP